jgi:hypothetical protein
MELDPDAFTSIETDLHKAEKVLLPSLLFLISLRERPRPFSPSVFAYMHI